MSIPPLVLLAIALLAIGPLVMASGLDLAARREGRAPRVDPIRIGLGLLLDLGGVAALASAFL